MTWLTNACFRTWIGYVATELDSDGMWLGQRCPKQLYAEVYV